MTEHKYAFSGRLECISILRIIGALGIALYHIGCFNHIIPTLQGGVHGALQKKAYMERLLRDACEYAALRGEGGTEPLGLIHQVEVTPVRELNEDAILQLCMSVPAENRRKGVFLMNASTMYALHGKLSGGALKLITSDWQGFKILNRPVVLLNNMPCMGEGQVPILFGDFGSVYILSAGHEDMHEKPHGRHPSNVICTMEGYMACTLSNREAVKGLKMV